MTRRTFLITHGALAGGSTGTGSPHVLPTYFLSSPARPFLAVGHRCITRNDAKMAVQHGANAIEFDIRYYDGTFWVRHDNLWGSPSTRLDDYLTNVRYLAGEFSHFTAMFLDIKDQGMTSARVHQLLDIVRSGTSDISGLSTLFAVTEYQRRSVFTEIIHSLGPRECIGIDGSDNPIAVADYFIGQGARNWAYAYGTTHWYESHDKIRPRVSLAARMKRNGGLFAFVYAWALKKQPTMRSYLRIGADGILADDVPNLVNVLKEDEFRGSIRLARRDDDIFAVPLLGRYLGDVSAKRVHDLFAEQLGPTGCQIDGIPISGRAYFAGVGAALRAGYGRCPKCLPMPEPPQPHECGPGEMWCDFARVPGCMTKGQCVPCSANPTLCSSKEVCLNGKCVLISNTK